MTQPRADDERLGEERGMARDVAIFDRFHERLARGDEERIPSELSSGCSAGKTR
ncbi:MAG: hypothetical protein KF723_06570 [Rhizobiaceae bacterium]|nr:hypothetical protein [Rhizobiaceae bacterium]